MWRQQQMAASWDSSRMGPLTSTCVCKGTGVSPQPGELMQLLKIVIRLRRYAERVQQLLQQ